MLTAGGPFLCAIGKCIAGFVEPYIPHAATLALAALTAGSSGGDVGANVGKTSAT